MVLKIKRTYKIAKWNLSLLLKISEILTDTLWTQKINIKYAIFFFIFYNTYHISNDPLIAVNMSKWKEFNFCEKQ